MSKEAMTQDLNPQQKEAMKYLDGPLLVLAGAGSGKTRVITHRYSYLVKNHKTPPESIFTVTFTNKAAGEMKGRISGLLGKDVRNAWIGTLHSQCGRLLRREIRPLGYGPDFTIYDEDDRCTLIRQILKELKIHEAIYRGVSSRINFLKASLIGPEEFLSSGDGFGFDEKLAKVYVRYQDELKRSNALDFDDLIMLAVRLFRDHPEVLKRYQQSFSNVLVDEFQDLNFAQYQFVKLLASGHGNICAVGDDDQSIYRFRGADVRHILNFERDFPDTKVVRLEQNYRSTQEILTVSNEVISKNCDRKPKKLWTDRTGGEKVHFCWLSNEEEEAKHIARIIKELFLKGAYSYNEIGILYRMNLQSRAVEDALRGMGLPYHVVGGISFYHRKEIKDIIAYVRLVFNHEDNVSFRRVVNCPQRGIGAATLARVEQEARKKSLSLFETVSSSLRNNGLATSTKEKMGSFVHLIGKLSSAAYTDAGELIKAISEQTGYMDMLDEERRQNVAELIASAEGKSVCDFLDKVSLVANSDETAPSGSISLMTLHNAKGLEFPVVFITGMEEGVLPHFKANGNEDEISEERRLCYVGMTRARDLLFLSAAHKRKLYSRIQEQERSRFLKDIPKDCCHWIEKVNTPQMCGWKGEQKQPPKKPQSIFPSGCRVKHPVWGIGVIRDCYGDGEDQKVMVNFPNIGLKRLSLKLANLTKI